MKRFLDDCRYVNGGIRKNGSTDTTLLLIVPKLELNKTQKQAADKNTVVDGDDAYFY